MTCSPDTIANWTCLVILASAAVLGADNVTRPDAGIETRGNGTIIRYTRTFLDQQSAITLRDLLRSIPGTAELVQDSSGNTGSDRRGFGSDGDQILINDKRVSAKSSTAGDQLDRIQADKVSYIDVIRGTVEGLDVRSQGRIINVVLSTEGAASGSWQANLWTEGREIKPDVLIAYADTIGQIEYQASLLVGPYNAGDSRSRNEVLFDPDGTAFDNNIERARVDADDIVFAATTMFPGPGSGRSNANFRIADTEQGELRTIENYGFEPDVSDGPINVLIRDSREDGTEWEFGGDTEYALGAGSVKNRLIYMGRRTDRAEPSLRVDPDGGTAEVAREESSEHATELILRSSYLRAIGVDQKIEIGIEAAANSLDKNVRLLLDTGNGLQEVDLPNADSVVEEKRGEFFSTHFWNITRNLAAETAINFEFSKISQTGSDIAQSRNFSFLKPRLDIRYDRSQLDQYRFSVQRTVSQLDFADFVVTFDNQEDNQLAGNPHLVPEKVWEFSLTYERRTLASNGLFSIRGFHQGIQDHIDRVQIGDSASGPGNIGDASVNGLEVQASLELEKLGMPDSTLELKYRFQESEAVDAFLLRERMVIDRPKHEISGIFRHNMPQVGLSYWFEFGWRSERVATEFDYIQIDKQSEIRVLMYLQKELFGNVSLWFNLRAGLGDRQRRDRRIYQGSIGNGILLRRELRRQELKPEFILGLRGLF